MPVKTKATPEEKIRIAQLCYQGKLSQGQAAEQMGVSKITIQGWLARYQAQGADSFVLTERYQSYSSDLKLKAVTDYLSGKGSQQVIAARYGLRSKTQLQRWIKMYNEGRDFGRKRSGSSGIVLKAEATMEKRHRSTTSVTSRSTPG